MGKIGRNVLKSKPVVKTIDGKYVFYEVIWDKRIKNQARKFEQAVRELVKLEWIPVLKDRTLWTNTEWYKIRDEPVLVGIVSTMGLTMGPYGGDYVGIICNNYKFLKRLLRKVKSNAKIHFSSIDLKPELKAAIMLLNINDPKKFKQALESAKKVI